MKFQKSSLGAGIVWLAMAASANATTVDFLSNNAYTTSGWNATVQTFQFDTNTMLLNYAFSGGSGSQGSYMFNLYDWTDNTLIFSQSSNNWIVGVNTISNIDTLLSAGHTYAAEVNYLGATNGGVQFSGDVYAGGSASWAMSPPSGKIGDYTNFAGYDTAFKLETSPSAGQTVSAPVPEPESYAMLLAGLSVMGIIGRRRRNNASNSAWTRQ
ncbi:MAG: hypothetical protein RIQ60_3766 [Pseudomonadota bacterium]|jgi:hypothetical protein